MTIELLEKTETDALYDVLYPILCRDDMRHIVPLSGKDSLSTFWIVLKFCQDHGIDPKKLEVLFNPTGFELKVVNEWMAHVEDKLGITINRVGDDLEEIIRDANYLPSHKQRFCTRLSKIFPMEEWIGIDPAFVYYGIRADEHRTGYQSLSMKKMNIMPVYPLKLAGYTLPMVWKLVHELDLVPPPILLARDV